MQVGGGVSQNPQPRTKLRIARTAEQNPTSVSHTADTSSHKGRRARAYVRARLQNAPFPLADPAAQGYSVTRTGLLRG